MWGLSPSDNNSQINNYKSQNGITNPCAGTEGGGPQAINIVNPGQPFIGYPTYIIVCPNKTVAYDICWPPTVNCFNSYFEDCAPIVTLEAIFDSDVTGVCQNGDIAFTDQSTGDITSWEWTFEGGTPASSNEQNPVVVYEQAGEFDVELTVSDGTNANTMSVSDYILVDALPEVSLADFGEVCINWSAFVLSGGLPEGGTYTGDGVMGDMFLPLDAGMGTHIITYTYMDENFCVASAQAEIEVTACVGIDPLENAPFVVYPNPSAGIFNIKLESGNAVKAQVLNQQGQTILTQDFTASTELNLEKYPEGVYYLRLTDSHETKLVRLVLVQN